LRSATQISDVFALAIVSIVSFAQSMFIAKIVIYRVGLTRKNLSQNFDPAGKPTESIDGFSFWSRNTQEFHDELRCCK